MRFSVMENTGDNRKGRLSEEALRILRGAPVDLFSDSGSLLGMVCDGGYLKKLRH